MTAFHKALEAFWFGFGMPAFFAGHVPDGQAFPYITFEAAECAPFGATVLTAIGWFQKANGTNANAQRAEFLDAAKAAISPWGKRLDVGGGLCAIYPNDVNFLSYCDDPEDDKVLGGRVSYEIHFYE